MAELSFPSSRCGCLPQPHVPHRGVATNVSYRQERSSGGPVRPTAPSLKPPLKDEDQPTVQGVTRRDGLRARERNAMSASDFRTCTSHCQMRLEEDPPARCSVRGGKRPVADIPSDERPRETHLALALTRGGAHAGGAQHFSASDYPCTSPSSPRGNSVAATISLAAFRSHRGLIRKPAGPVVDRHNRERRHPAQERVMRLGKVRVQAPVDQRCRDAHQRFR
jgi:hypothetical protein